MKNIDDKIFDRNLEALSQRNPELSAKIKSQKNTDQRYTFQKSRTGEIIPALYDSKGTVYPLHSTVAPGREAARLIDSIEGEGLLILMGLGGGYHAEAALKREGTALVLVIDYNMAGIAELMRNCDYTALFRNTRFTLLVDPSDDELEKHILKIYQPALYGGINLIPLRPRTNIDKDTFINAGEVISLALDKVSADFSVQAHFGKRWFSNIIRNIENAGTFRTELHAINKAAIHRAAICAAGPSLSLQLKELCEKKDDLYIIAADTALPCLIHGGVIPDAVISIDCQHISYYHFMDGFPKNTLLFLDLVSPPSLASRSEIPFFFYGPHPLCRYISRFFKALPELDASGGNVTYAALSLAEKLGASEIEIYGADFSYPLGQSYAKSTYIHTYFEKRQSRFLSLEAQASAFLFKSPLEKYTGNDSWYYESQILKFYREKLENKCSIMAAKITPIHGIGAPIKVGNPPVLKNQLNTSAESQSDFNYEIPAMSAGDFLLMYKNGLEKLPKPEKNAADYICSLTIDEQSLLNTILPTMAAIKQEHPMAEFREVFERTRLYCIAEIAEERLQNRR